MGILESFTNFVFMLHQDVSALVLLNGKSTAPFSIQCSVWQCCLLVPYFSLLIGKSLHMVATVQQRLERIHSI